MEIERLYRDRFDQRAIRQKEKIWKVFRQVFFQKLIPEESVVLDIGAGYCEFINHIKCKNKYAVDLNQDTLTFANADVGILNCSSKGLALSSGLVDAVFMNNLLGRLRTKDDIITILLEVFGVPKPGGLLIILQPNIRYLHQGYWEFFDHHIPLSDRSMAETLRMTGFRIKKVFPKCLPYTTKSRIPKRPIIVPIYLNLPFIRSIFGKQRLTLGRKDV
jgi:SAM-dependent methyltransferase